MQNGTLNIRITESHSYDKNIHDYKEKLGEHDHKEDEKGSPGRKVKIMMLASPEHELLLLFKKRKCLYSFKIFLEKILLKKKLFRQ